MAASFLPITLEQLARDQGVLLSDHKTPCRASWHTVHNGTVSDQSTSPKHNHNELPACVIQFAGTEINTASFAMYTFSISVLVQALLIISMSGAADHGRFRKTFLLVFAFVGASATMLFLVVVPQLYLLGAALAIISNTCFGASFVLLNSFLPVLVRHHPSVQADDIDDDLEDIRTSTSSQRNAMDDDAGMASSISALLPGTHSDRTAPVIPVSAAVSPQLRLSTRISSNGIGIGYIAGLLVQTIGICIVISTGSTTFSLRLVLFVVGAWWLAFSIPAALWLRPRPGPPLPTSLTGTGSWFGYVIYAWKALFKTISRARRLKDIVIFLGAWFLVSDGIATVSG